MAYDYCRFLTLICDIYLQARWTSQAARDTRSALHDKLHWHNTWQGEFVLNQFEGKGVYRFPDGAFVDTTWKANRCVM